jgi:hypothetical protein
MPSRKNRKTTLPRKKVKKEGGIIVLESPAKGHAVRMIAPHSFQVGIPGEHSANLRVTQAVILDDMGDHPSIYDQKLYAIGNILYWNGNTVIIGGSESDPIFEASPAAGITIAQKGEWDDAHDHSEGDGSDHTGVGHNTLHRQGPGGDHADVAANTLHGAGDGSDHADVAANTLHGAGSGGDHADVAANTSHGAGSGGDHADVAANTSHGAGSGGDHADVASNTSHRSGTGGDHSAVASNTSHRSGTGGDHSAVAANTVAVAATVSATSTNTSNISATVLVANAALPKAGGAMVGAITTNSTFDGVDVATRDGVLTTTTATANAAATAADLTSHEDDTGNPHEVDKGNVGLNNVDNTSDASKPVSTAGAAADALKANIASPTFSGTVGGITPTMVGLGSVTNVDHAGALATHVATLGTASTKAFIDEDSFATNSAVSVPSQQSVKAYVLANAGGLPAASDGETTTGTSTTVAVTPANLDSITKLGTVGTGRWDATTIAVNKGGTGSTTLTEDAVLIGADTGAVATVLLDDGELLVGQDRASPAGAVMSGAVTMSAAGVTAVDGGYVSTINGNTPAQGADVVVPNVEITVEKVCLGDRCANIGGGTAEWKVGEIYMLGTDQLGFTKSMGVGGHGVWNGEMSLPNLSPAVCWIAPYDTTITSVKVTFQILGALAGDEVDTPIVLAGMVYKGDTVSAGTNAGATPDPDVLGKVSNTSATSLTVSSDVSVPVSAAGTSMSGTAVRANEVLYFAIAFTDVGVALDEQKFSLNVRFDLAGKSTV